MWGTNYMEYFYCDASAIIDLFKRDELLKLSQFKGIFHVADLQLAHEIKYPKGIVEATKQFLTIDVTTIEMIEKCYPITLKHKPLSKWDVLALVFCIEKEYCLVTNDIKLQKACGDYNVEFVSLEYIEEKFVNGGDENENIKK